MSYLPVPCPLCGGIVNRTATCSNGHSWESVKRMCGEAATSSIEHASQVANNGVWQNKEDVLRNIQTIIDDYERADKYYQQLEKELR